MASYPAPQFLPAVLFGIEPTPTATATLPATATLHPIASLTPTATVPAVDELENGNFEAGRNGAWLEAATSGIAIITSNRPTGLAAHSGIWLAWLGGVLNDTRGIQQVVTVPPNRPYLLYWHWIASRDACGYDVAGVAVGENEIVDAFWLCDDNDTNGWLSRVIDLRAWSGQSIELTFLTGTDASLNSNWFVDDVAFVTGARADVASADAGAAERLRAVVQRGFDD